MLEKNFFLLIDMPGFGLFFQVPYHLQGMLHDENDGEKQAILNLFVDMVLVGHVTLLDLLQVLVIFDDGIVLK